MLPLFFLILQITDVELSDQMILSEIGGKKSIYVAHVTDGTLYKLDSKFQLIWKTTFFEGKSHEVIGLSEEGNHVFIGIKPFASFPYVLRITVAQGHNQGIFEEYPFDGYPELCQSFFWGGEGRTFCSRYLRVDPTVPFRHYSQTFQFSKNMVLTLAEQGAEGLLFTKFNLDNSLAYFEQSVLASLQPHAVGVFHRDGNFYFVSDQALKKISHDSTSQELLLELELETSQPHKPLMDLWLDKAALRLRGLKEQIPIEEIQAIQSRLAAAYPKVMGPWCLIDLDERGLAIIDAWNSKGQGGFVVDPKLKIQKRFWSDIPLFWDEGRSSSVYINGNLYALRVDKGKLNPIVVNLN